MRVSTRMRATAAAVATALAVPVISLVAIATPANAEVYKGVTTASLNVRSFPTPAARLTGTWKKDTKVTIACKIQGPDVDGNRFWYRIQTGKNTWRYAAARYIENVGKVPHYCTLGPADGQVTAKPSVKLRTAPSLEAKAAGSLKYGAKLNAICKVNGDEVDGNERWYQLYDGRWVTARYIKNLNGLVPEFCK
ncbi:SH3 domain-containing protein [Tenggerimyces flavus]|uniref:SH3 domain-containing protein n=1 Tax=Tenggerimyces flavus TaxID=1708749 RepID=A0ABV7Y9S0_9ACTN|nr:SH3 domain-containing protein [Tenggerimyces flavus]MBM7785233.1 uncharacterized protein YgiM (DUF1202 family) [Tenggerimyces flavus]